MSAAVFCAKCATWRDLFAPCGCPRPRPAPPSASNMAHVVNIAAALAGDRIRRGVGPSEVTADEMTEASAIARSTAEA